MPDYRVGVAYRSMLQQIDSWQAQGRALSQVVRQTLLDQAVAVDLARTARRPTAITSANRGLLDLLTTWRLADDAPPAPDDPFNALVAQLKAGDDGAG